MTISKINKSANLNAIKQGFEWRNAKFENLALIKNNGMGVIIKGEHPYKMRMPRNIDFDVAVHNHTTHKLYNQKFEGGLVGLSDIISILAAGGKKVIACTKNGYTSMDFSNSTAPFSEIKAVITKQQEKLRLMAEQIAAKRVSQGKSPINNDYEPLKTEMRKMNIKLAKKFKWIYSEVKWSDFKKQ